MMKHPMINIYAKLIKLGSRDLGSVPEELRAEVERAVANAKEEDKELI